MLLRRSIRAIPYVLLAAVFGATVGFVWGFSPLIGAGACAGLLAVLIGRDIWRERHAWNDLEQDYARRGFEIRDLM